jgi:hypothetical protein
MDPVYEEPKSALEILIDADERREALVDKISDRVKDKSFYYDCLNVDWDCIDDEVLEAIANETIMWATFDPTEEPEDDEHGEGVGILTLGLKIEADHWGGQLEGSNWPDTECQWATDFVEDVIGLTKVESSTGVICWKRIDRCSFCHNDPINVCSVCGKQVCIKYVSQDAAKRCQCTNCKR